MHVCNSSVDRFIAIAHANSLVTPQIINVTRECGADQFWFNCAG